ncbi:MAG: hypothetical protein ABWY93_04705 [Mycobacterium sp.]
MDALAIVGSTRFVDRYAMAEARLWIEGVLERRRPDLVVSGGAKGIDTLAVEMARERGIDVEEFRPAHQQWEPDGFKDRNDLIAARCTRLMRIVCRWSETYGSGYTRDRAQEQDKLCWSLTLPREVCAGTVEVTYGKATLKIAAREGVIADPPPFLQKLGWQERDAEKLIGWLRQRRYPVRWVPAEIVEGPRPRLAPR